MIYGIGLNSASCIIWTINFPIKTAAKPLPKKLIALLYSSLYIKIRMQSF